ncbi:hypothetical protein Cantr_05812 [Candida viswanathii]|uniref:Uncharacterized protein n=1 Tax=Candida viswanathii TaxID=5486 RepID=A0A367XQ97_9ASCO|nr:hypothetical protein Cantr_05812 [Candida viswanathii]
MLLLVATAAFAIALLDVDQDAQSTASGLERQPIVKREDDQRLVDLILQDVSSAISVYGQSLRFGGLTYCGLLAIPEVYTAYRMCLGLEPNNFAPPTDCGTAISEVTTRVASIAGLIYSGSTDFANKLRAVRDWISEMCKN